MTRVRLSDGTLLNTRLDGPEGAPWLVMSNSLGSNLSMWDGQIDLLTAKYRVLRYDHRGHGASDVPPGPYTFDRLTADVIDLMDHHGIETADFIGLSMGAMTGMGLAIHHAPRFGRMVLADGRADAPEMFKAMWDQRIAVVSEYGTEGVADGTLEMWLSADWRAENPEATRAVRDMIAATDPNGYIACCQGLKTLNYLKDLGSVGNPVLYICGANDKGAPPEVMRAMAKATPGAAYVEIPNAGHVPNINRPQAFNAAIADFLDI